MAEKLSWYQKLIAKLATIRAMGPHKQKPEFEHYAWQPGAKPLLDINGDGKNFCPYPGDMRLNTADRVNRARHQRDDPPQEDNSDLWAAANDPALAHYDAPAPPSAIGSPDDPIYIQNRMRDQLKRT